MFLHGCLGVLQRYRGVPTGMYKVSSRSRDCIFMRWANSERLCLHPVQCTCCGDGLVRWEHDYLIL